jgi:DNA-directed RNA polymerase subunit omega
LIEPKIESLLKDVDSKYTLVVLAAKRSRQINSYFNQLGEGVAEYAPPQIPMIPDRAPKALSIAMQEIADGSVGYERSDEGSATA